jgi:thiamine biosynthesis lipoprotein
MHAITLACHAMATRFELVLHGPDPAALRAAGEEAVQEIERLEARLSLYRPESEIAHLNARAAREPVRVTPDLFALLQQARRLHEETEGAFDITIGPLVRCWGFMGGAQGRCPDAEELAQARARVGMDKVRLEAETLTVEFEREGMILDLGAIGKGYAVERAAELLREAGVASALLHGGTSTVYALGQPPGAEGWMVAIVNPEQGESAETLSPNLPAADSRGRGVGARAPLATVPLKDEAMSVSAVWGRSFEEGGRRFGHVLDPRTGEPARRAVLTAVVLPSATETDALSTALLVRGAEGHEGVARLRPGMRTLVAAESEGGLRVESRNIAVEKT